jgi:hypothetical protein
MRIRISIIPFDQWGPETILIRVKEDLRLAFEVVTGRRIRNQLPDILP